MPGRTAYDTEDTDRLKIGNWHVVSARDTKLYPTHFSKSAIDGSMTPLPLFAIKFLSVKAGRQWMPFFPTWF